MLGWELFSELQPYKHLKTSLPWWGAEVRFIILCASQFLGTYNRGVQRDLKGVSPAKIRVFDGGTRLACVMFGGQGGMYKERDLSLVPYFIYPIINLQIHSDRPRNPIHSAIPIAPQASRAQTDLFFGCVQILLHLVATSAANNFWISHHKYSGVI